MTPNRISRCFVLQKLATEERKKPPPPPPPRKYIFLPTFFDISIVQKPFHAATTMIDHATFEGDLKMTTEQQQNATEENGAPNQEAAALRAFDTKSPPRTIFFSRTTVLFLLVAIGVALGLIFGLGDLKKGENLGLSEISTTMAATTDGLGTPQCFQDREELLGAVRDYQSGDSERTFALAEKYGWPISTWCVTPVANFSGIFRGAATFDEDLWGWDLSNAVDLSYMFHGAESFSGKSIVGWNVSQVRTMKSMFFGATFFDANLSQWDVSQVTNMASMFHNNLDGLAPFFMGSGLDMWNVSSVEDMTLMFYGTSRFNANFSLWDTSSLRTLRWTFYNSRRFEGIGLENWDVSNVRDMSFAFDGATTFNADLSEWNVSSVTSLWSTFEDAWAFEGTGLSNWDVSNVQDIRSVVRNAYAFNESLCSWGDLLGPEVLTEFETSPTTPFEGSACPDPGTPDLLLSMPPGPFCYSCNISDI